MRVFLFTALVLFVSLVQASTVLAQVEDSLIEQRVEELLDEDGENAVDINDAWDYLEIAPTINAPPLQKTHAQLRESWIEVYREMKRYPVSQVDSVSHLYVRTRTGSALNPQDQQGYISGSYIGSPQSYYNRIRASSGIIALSAIEQKKPWESGLTNHLGGFLQLSHSLELGPLLTVRSAIVGDYSLSFGNGLLFGNSFAASPSKEAARSIEEGAFGVRGTLSQSAKALRGAALDIISGPLDLTLFVSQRSLDASLFNDTIQTIYATNYYRTEDEVAAKGQANVRAFGGHLDATTSDTSSPYIRGGIIAALINYDHSYNGTASNPFTGRSLSLASGSVLIIGKRLALTAETGISKTDTSKTIATIVTGLFQASSGLKLALLYRHIPYTFASPFGSIAGEIVASNSNIDGFYAGIELFPVGSILKLNAYAKIENGLVPIVEVFPKLKNDYLLSSFIRPSSKVDINTYFRTTSNSALEWSDSTRKNLITSQHSTTRLRIEAEYRLNSTIAIRSRCDYANYDKSETGWLGWEELRTTVSKDIHLTLGIGRFIADSYNSAIWLYESGVPGSGSITALYGKGWKINCRTTYKIWSGFSLSGSIAGSFFDMPRTIGSGVTSRITSSDFDTALQLDFHI